MTQKYKTDGKYITTKGKTENWPIACAENEDMAEKIAAALNFYEEKGNDDDK